MSEIFAPAYTPQGDVFGPAVFSGITGEGALALPSVTTSGAGFPAASIAGTGNFSVLSPSVSGSGAAFAAIQGAGALTLAQVSVSGFGAAAANLAGVGAMLLQAAAVAGVGAVISPAVPEISDGGNLSVTVPYYAEAVALDYPAIADWVAGFASSVPVTNDAPFVVEVQDSPKSITFRAANEFGAATITRTLTVTVAANDGLLHPNQADLRMNYPQFADPAAFSYQQLQQALANARAHISDANYGRLRGQSRLKAIYLMAGHLLAIQQQAQNGGVAGVVTGSNVDKVGVQFAAPPVKSQWAWWLSTTAYGAELLALMQSAAAGGFYIPGGYAMAGFRKANGGF